MSQGVLHGFGGDWTERKLQAIRKYLSAYLTALKDKPVPEKPFELLYIDAFAGTGERAESREDSSTDAFLFPELAKPEPLKMLAGSARIALEARGRLQGGKVGPPFREFIFIEKNAKRCAKLEGLKDDYPSLADRISVRQGDANSEVQKICAEENWSSRRAVMFLDPYGMQVEWRTLQVIAQTRAIDLWLLFPLGIGVNRLLVKSGNIPREWRARLDRLFGTTEWYDEFYKFKQVTDLLGHSETLVEKATNEQVARYFNKRLETIFPKEGVAAPALLCNSTNNPLYLLCFAAGNSKGAKTATNIASHILKETR